MSSMTAKLEKAIDDLIISWSYDDWCLIAIGIRNFWHVNESLGSDIAMIPEGAD